MDIKAKTCSGGLILLATAALSLILVLIVGSWPIVILPIIVTMAAAVGGFVWTSRCQQHQFIERLKKFDISPEKGRFNEANLRRMCHGGGQAQKDAVTLICLSQECSVDETYVMFKKRPTRQEVNQMAMQQLKGRKRPYH